MKKEQIKILSPVDRIEEVLPLIKAGADEFFCGFLIRGEIFSSIRESVKRISDNKYDYSKFNASSLDEFIALARLIKSKGKKIFLALNSPFLDESKIKIAEDIINRIKNLNIDGVIISDLRLVNILKNAGMNMVASSYLEVKNEEAVKYLIVAGFKRIIFDRQVTLADIKIIKKYPQMEFETFVLHSGCRSLGGYCCRGYILADKKQLKNIKMSSHPCCGIYKIANRQKIKKPDLSINKNIIAGRLTMPANICGACAIYQFKKYGITSIKIVGRGYPTDKKITSVKFIKKCLSLSEQFKNKKDYYKETRRLFEHTFNALNEGCLEKECYYPHFFN